MNKANNKTNSTGISFTRLIPFLSLSFKRELAKDINLVKKTFVLHSNTAYETLWKVIKANVEEEESYKDKKQYIQKIGRIDRILSIFKKHNPRKS